MKLSNINYDFSISKFCKFKKFNLLYSPIFRFTSKNNKNQFYSNLNEQSIPVKNLSIYSKKSILISLGIIILATFQVIYLFFWRKYNPHSKQHKLYAINYYIQNFISTKADKKINNLLEKFYLKRENYPTEYAVVEEALNRILIIKNLTLIKTYEKNYLNESLKIDCLVVDIPYYGCFLKKVDNNKMQLVLSKCLIIACNYDKEKIEFFILTEISNMLRGNLEARDISICFEKFSQLQENSKIFELTNERKLHLNQVEQFFLFYPKNKVVEREFYEVLKLATTMGINCELSLENMISAIELVDEKMNLYTYGYYKKDQFKFTSFKEMLEDVFEVLLNK